MSKYRVTMKNTGGTTEVYTTRAENEAELRNVIESFERGGYKEITVERMEGT